MNENFVITGINRVVMVGKDEYPEQIISFENALEHNELIFHFSGHATVYIDDQILETKANTIRVLPKGKTSRYDVVRHERGECIVIYFDTDVKLCDSAFVIDAAKNEKLGAYFKKTFSTWVSKKEGYYFECISLLYRIFAEMQKDTSIPKQHRLKIAPAIEVIHSEFLKRDFSLSELSDMCNMGESYFQRLFKEIHGISPKKYIIQLKINHACDLLRLERYSVTHVAELCNFSDVYFFSRQFKEYVGITPTQFIQKYRSSK